MILIKTVMIPEVRLMVMVNKEEIKFVKNVAEFSKSLSQFSEKMVFAVGKPSKKPFILLYKVLM